MNSPEKKIRVLALCDSPTSATGFAQVSKNILNGLAKTGKYDIDVLGINYYGDFYDRDKFPYQIYPAQPQGYQDMFGRGRLMNALNGVEEKFGLKPGWDIVFTIQDSFVLEGLGGTFPFADQLKVTQQLWRRTVDMPAWFKWIGYFPVDSKLKENWVTHSIALPDEIVAYCNWGKKEILEFDRNKFSLPFNMKQSKDGSSVRAHIPIAPMADRVSVIHHGVETTQFFPISAKERAAFRREFFNGEVKDDTFLVVNVSRNQPRKDLTRTMAVFAKLLQKMPNAHLYLHCKEEDVGGSIQEIGRNFGLTMGKDYSLPKDFNAGVGYSVDMVNKIYNAADVCITTTLGEGWGFITTEAMAAKVPIIAPNITSILDIFNSYTSPEFLESDPNKLNDWLFKEGGIDKVRGIPVMAGSTSSEWFSMGAADNERIRPLTNVDDMVEKILWVKNNPEKVKEIVERGYEWVIQQNWGKIVEQWDAVFTRSVESLEKDRRLGTLISKAGRNDDCPCGSGKKFKKCHGSDDSLAKFADWLTDHPVSE